MDHAVDWPASLAVAHFETGGHVFKFLGTIAPCSQQRMHRQKHFKILLIQEADESISTNANIWRTEGKSPGGRY
ncbi:MAG: hypothetical protein CAK90_08865 [Spartobacteria bacterium AMD-G4]|nr:MAG: hypothetical protein CAK90_08865 [Spartobacteria bacterium AMD-G4]